MTPAARSASSGTNAHARKSAARRAVSQRQRHSSCFVAARTIAHAGGDGAHEARNLARCYTRGAQLGLDAAAGAGTRGHASAAQLTLVVVKRSLRAWRQRRVLLVHTQPPRARPRAFRRRGVRPNLQFPRALRKAARRPPPRASRVSRCATARRRRTCPFAPRRQPLGFACAAAQCPMAQHKPDDECAPVERVCAGARAACARRARRLGDRRAYFGGTGRLALGQQQSVAPRRAAPHPLGGSAARHVGCGCYARCRAARLGGARGATLRLCPEFVLPHSLTSLRTAQL